MYSGYTFFHRYVCSLGIEPTTFALLTQRSTTEPQEQEFQIHTVKELHWPKLLNSSVLTHLCLCSLISLACPWYSVHLEDRNLMTLQENRE